MTTVLAVTIKTVIYVDDDVFADADHSEQRSIIAEHLDEWWHSVGPSERECAVDSWEVLETIDDEAC